jgi:hypothetical protein
VRAKIIINDNHFQFDRKSLFNFLNENHKSFSKFKLLILARAFMRIRHRRALEFVGSSTLPLKSNWCQNLVYQNSATSLDSDNIVRIPDNLVRILKFLTDFGSIGRIPANLAEIRRPRRTLPDSDGGCRIPFYVFGFFFFFRSSQMLEIFSKRSF